MTELVNALVDEEVDWYKLKYFMYFENTKTLILNV